MCFGVQPCNKRSTKSSFASRYPFKIEPGFSEADELWQPTSREDRLERNARLHRALSELFEEEEKSTYVSITSHVGCIRGLLDIVQFPRSFEVMPGGMIPLVGKSSRLL